MAFAAKNTGFFAMALMLAAKSLGLDTHPMDGFDHAGVKEAFNIPEEYWVQALISVGYLLKDTTLSPPKWRKTMEEIVVNFNCHEPIIVISVKAATLSRANATKPPMAIPPGNHT